MVWAGLFSARSVHTGGASLAVDVLFAEVSDHASIIGLRELERVDPRPNPLVWWATDKALWLMQQVYGGVRVELEGTIPDLREPVLLAMNHSHYYDFMPSRHALWRQLGFKSITFTKARAYQNRLEGLFVKGIGNVPLVSRGYLISADFAVVHGRKPSEEEYRLVREHVDRGRALPSTPAFERLLSEPRDMLDVPFDPRVSSYRDALNARYFEAMQVSVGQARRVIDAGVCLHIYPQGLYSTRLSRGRIGTVQFALALDIPIVPVGFSGMNELFATANMVPRRAGTLTMRFGQPRRVHGEEFADFVPFDPAHEQRVRAALERETDALMDAINELLEPSYQWGEDRAGNGRVGVSRFFD